MKLDAVQLIADSDPDYVMNALMRKTDGRSATTFKIHFSTLIKPNGTMMYSVLIEYYAE